MNVADFEWPSEEELNEIMAKRTPLTRLADQGEALRGIMHASGTEQGEKLRQDLPEGAVVLVTGRPIDFEGFASGVVEVLEAHGIDVRVGCLWLGSGPSSGTELSASLVTGSYVDDGHEMATHAFVARSVVDDWKQATTTLLWTRHQAPSATLGLVGYRAEKHELESALAEISLSTGIEVDGSFSLIDEDDEFDGFNEFTALPRTDDALHKPSFLDGHMRAQTRRRSKA